MRLPVLLHTYAWLYLGWNERAAEIGQNMLTLRIDSGDGNQNMLTFHIAQCTMVMGIL